MESLEKGMYVRFKDKRGITYVRKIVKIANEYPQKLYGIEIDKEANYSIYLSKKNILNSSHNVFDLIETHDLIKTTEDETFEVFAVGSDCVYINGFAEFVTLEHIKSILTKEQMESMEYKL